MSYTIQSNSLELHSNTVQQSNLTKKFFIVVVVVVAVMFLGVVAICARVSNDKRSEPAADEQPWKIQPGRVGRSLVHSTQIANSIKNTKSPGKPESISGNLLMQW